MAYFSFSPNNLPVVFLMKCICKQAGQVTENSIVVHLIGCRILSGQPNQDVHAGPRASNNDVRHPLMVVWPSPHLH